MQNDKPVVDHLLDGFKLSASMTYLRKLKQVLAMALEGSDNEVSSMVQMAGFGLQLGVAADVEFTFDDEEDLKEHP